MSAGRNPSNFSFEWKKGNLTVGRRNILQRSLTADNEGSYSCRVSNSVGAGKTCETAVYFPGVSEQLSSSGAIVSIVVSSAVVVCLAVALAIVYGRKIRNNNK